MPITPTTKSLLKINIENALKAARDAGAPGLSADQKSGSDEIIAVLADGLTNSIDNYVTTCIVSTLPGQPIVGTAAGIPIVGQTVAPATSGG